LIMNISLVRKLVSNGIIRQNTEIDAYYMGVDISGCPIARTRGTFFIRNVKINERTSTIIFDTVSTVDGLPKTIFSNDVKRVDGMPIDRLAGIYGISGIGEAINQGKRRGRRPKAKVEVEAQ